MRLWQIVLAMPKQSLVAEQKSGRERSGSEGSLPRSNIGALTAPNAKIDNKRLSHGMPRIPPSVSWYSMLRWWQKSQVPIEKKVTLSHKDELGLKSNTITLGQVGKGLNQTVDAACVVLPFLFYWMKCPKKDVEWWIWFRYEESYRRVARAHLVNTPSSVDRLTFRFALHVPIEWLNEHRANVDRELEGYA
jgi:hypothetical protein